MIAPFWLLLPSPACHRRRIVRSAGGELCSVLCSVSRPGGVLGWAFRVVAIPQSGLVSQVSSLRLPSGHSVPVLTLSNAARTSLPSRMQCGRDTASTRQCYLLAVSLPPHSTTEQVSLKKSVHHRPLVSGRKLHIEETSKQREPPQKWQVKLD